MELQKAVAISVIVIMIAELRAFSANMLVISTNDEEDMTWDFLVKITDTQLNRINLALLCFEHKSRGRKLFNSQGLVCLYLNVKSHVQNLSMCKETCRRVDTSWNYFGFCSIWLLNDFIFLNNLEYMRKILITTQKLICRRPPWCCSHLKAITAVYKVPVIHDLLLDHEGRKPDGRRGNEGSCFTCELQTWQWGKLFYLCITVKLNVCFVYYSTISKQYQ